MPVEVVIDTSILAKVFFDETDSDRIRGWIGGVSLFAPRYICIEVASVALKKMRDGLATQALAQSAAARAPEFIDVLAPDEDLLSPAMDLGLQSGLSLYDGLFAALALRSGLPFVTADLRCAERLASGGSGVRCLTPPDLAWVSP